MRNHTFSQYAILTTTVLLGLTLTGCQAGGSGFLGGPEVVSGNERYVTIYDFMGIPGQKEQAAAAYCKQYGRYSQFQSRGGDNYHCSGQNQNLCTTYNCVE